MWQSELLIKPKGELFTQVEENPVEAAFLQKMTGLQLVEADLTKTGLSIGKHPMAFIREELNRKGILSAEQTRKLKKKEIVSAAGAVIVRQRPMTANNVVFITLEDETGHSNFIVLPDIFERFRPVIMQNNFLIIGGVAEKGRLIKALFFSPIKEFTSEVTSHDFH